MLPEPAIERYAANSEGRDFVAGDLHGMYFLLEELMERVSFNTVSDRLFSVGDLCDRGPESLRVLEYVDQPWFHACLGNHGDMLLNALGTGEAYAASLWSLNGGDWGLQLNHEQQQRLVQIFSRLPLAMEIDSPALGKVGIVHAEVPQGMDWAVFTSHLELGDVEAREQALWSRARISRLFSGEPPESVPSVDLIFCGHTILREPKLVSNIYYLDTGAFIGESGCLSMVELKEGLPLVQASGAS